MNSNKLFGFFRKAAEEEAELEVLNTITESIAEEQGEQKTVAGLDELQSESLTQAASEEQNDRAAELMKSVYRHFRAVGHKFYFKDQPDTVAFEVKGQRVVSKFRDERVAKAMVALSEAKGWKRIKISGDREFRRAVWLEASIRGIKSLGYQPTEQDLSELESIAEKSAKNHIEPVSGEPSAFQNAASEVTKQRTNSAQYAHSCESGHHSEIYKGQILGHGAAPYKNEPKNKDSYFVKLLTDQGEKVIWGVDLKRAMNKNPVQKGDRVTLEFKGNKEVTVDQKKYDQQGNFLGTETIATHRNEWEFQKISSQEKASTASGSRWPSYDSEFYEKSKVAQAVSPEICDIGLSKFSTPSSQQPNEQYKLVEAVADSLICRTIKNSEKRKMLKSSVQSRLNQLAESKKMPTIHMYDKNAPFRGAQRPTELPVAERNTERTR